MKKDNIDSYILEQYFCSYNREFQHLSESSIAHYCDAIRKISSILRSFNKVNDSLYEISELKDLDEIRAFLDNNSEFKELDDRGHRMYSCGFKKYYEFATAAAFENIGNEISSFDYVSNEIDVPPRLVNSIVSRFRRSSIVKKQVIKAAHFQCEINKNHVTFIAESTKQQYMEGHHLIALEHQDEFDKNLDVYSNVMCLCPICHRLLHYGIEKEKIPLLDFIYSRRAERLRHSGIILTKDDFFDLAM